VFKKEDNRKHLEKRIANLAINIEAYWRSYRNKASGELKNEPKNYKILSDKSYNAYLKAFIDYVDIYLKIFSSDIRNEEKTELFIALQDNFYELKGLPKPKRRHVGIKDIEKEISESIQKEKEHKLKGGKKNQLFSILPPIQTRHERYKIIFYILIAVIILGGLINYSYYTYLPLIYKTSNGMPYRNITGNLTGIIITKEERLNFAPIVRNIDTIEWFEDTTKVIQLDKYFFDPDGDILTYKIKNFQNIMAVIDPETSKLTFSQEQNWNGKELIFIEATDSIHTIESNSFEIIVKPTPDCGMDGCETGENSQNCPLDCKSSESSTEEAEELLAKESKKLLYNPETGEKVIEEKIQEYLAEPVQRPKEYQAKSSILFGIAPLFKITDSIPIDRNISTIDLQSLSPSPIPCVITTRVDSQFVFNATQEDKGKAAKDYSGIVPEGYDIIIPVFNVNCRQEELEFTINVPNNYIDVKALKCRKNNCTQQKAIEVTELKCGDDVAKEVSRKEKFYQAQFIEINITTLNFTSFDDVLRNGKNTVKFLGPKFEELTASIILPEERIPQPTNPSSIILNTFILRIEKNKGAIDSIITMPYTLPKNVDENSLGMYLRHNNTWNYFGGEINRIEKVVTANLTNIPKYLDSKGELQLAVIGSICINCLKTDFKLAYNPVIPSKDAIILIHGIASNPATFQEIIDDFKLAKQPWQLWTFGYPSYQRIEQNSKELEDFLQANSDKYDTVYIVSHSLGGLIAQKAIYDSYVKNLNDSSKYYYVKKVKKLVLIATPNNGTPVAEFYYNMISFVVNSKNFYSPFGHKTITEELFRGLITPRIPWVKYYVIAGTRPYEINAVFFKASSSSFFQNEDNDGIVGVKSSRFVGDRPINNKCNDYWELNLTHSELIDDYLGRKLIEQVLSKEVSATVEGAPISGFNSYYEIKTECNLGDKFIVIGKKISKNKVYDPFGCSCGNNVCNIGENAKNCPLDCKSRKINVDYKLTLIVILIILLAIFIVTKLMSKEYLGKVKESKYKSHFFVFRKAKEEEKHIRKIKEMPLGFQTDIDLAYKMLIEKKRIKISDISSNFGISMLEADEWARILEENKLAKIHYPLFGDAELILEE